MFCREGYKTFERDTNEMICEPLKGLLNQVLLLGAFKYWTPPRPFITLITALYTFVMLICADPCSRNDSQVSTFIGIVFPGFVYMENIDRDAMSLHENVVTRSGRAVIRPTPLDL